MSVSTTQLTVADLLEDFTNAGPDDLHTEYQRLVGALWNDGELTEQALAATPALVAYLDEAGDDRKGYVIILLALLAEAEYPAVDGEVATAVRQGLDRYLDLVGGAVKGRPLTLALLYLLSHFPGDRDRILAAVEHLDLDPGDQSRLDRALRTLDLDAPDLGALWPSPSVWQLTDDERAFNQEWVRTLTPAQVTTNWENDTRTLLGYTGAKAYFAVRYGAPVVAGGAVSPGDATVPEVPADSGTELFARHADAFHCPSCGGPLDFTPDVVRCDACATRYPLARGILDLSEGVSESAADVEDDATANLLSKLAEMPTMGIYYESVLRPAFLRIAGGNWGGAVTLADEDAYVAQHIRPVDGPVLDVAAGAGRWTTVVAETVGRDRLIALDMGLPMLTVLRGKLPEVPAVRASALDIPFGDSTMGAVNCWNALHAFPDDAARAIAEVGRVLRPGGTFTLMTFLFDSDPIARYFQASHYFPSRVEGMLLFELDELKRWLSAAGMTVRDVSGPGSFAFITAVRD
ncbi:methyltransferase domain-containing protein [Sphaerisporangium sp. NPDC049002]|uniref:methyltransferase domain-containing protein n=1 Tax=Sphaerisporangium sp. NPDC049002 TaxID=3155392 RepID=UPI0033C9918C